MQPHIYRSTMISNSDPQGSIMEETQKQITMAAYLHLNFWSNKNTQKISCWQKKQCSDFLMKTFQIRAQCSVVYPINHKPVVSSTFLVTWFLIILIFLIFLILINSQLFPYFFTLQIFTFFSVFVFFKSLPFYVYVIYFHFFWLGFSISLGGKESERSNKRRENK